MAVRLRLHVFPHIGMKDLDALTPSDIREWLRVLQEKSLAASYRQVIFIHAQTILNAAIDDELIKKNPATPLRFRSHRFHIARSFRGQSSGFMPFTKRWRTGTS